MMQRLWQSAKVKVFAGVLTLALFMRWQLLEQGATVRSKKSVLRCAVSPPGTGRVGKATGA